MDYAALVREAFAARENAYAPYSDFLVGAALLAENGKAYRGCNVENAAFTPGSCAERTALYAAVAEGVRRFRAIAIVGAKREAGTFAFCFENGRRSPSSASPRLKWLLPKAKPTIRFTVWTCCCPTGSAGTA